MNQEMRQQISEMEEEIKDLQHKIVHHPSYKESLRERLISAGQDIRFMRDFSSSNSQSQQQQRNEQQDNREIFSVHPSDGSLSSIALGLVPPTPLRLPKHVLHGNPSMLTPSRRSVVDSDSQSIQDDDFLLKTPSLRLSSFLLSVSF